MSAPFPPVVDLDRPGAAAAIDDACREVGFFQVVNHGIPRSAVDAAFTAADRFFLQPLSEKTRWASPDPEVERGYSAKGNEAFAYSLDMERPPDLFEAFSVARDEYPPDDPQYVTTEHNFFKPNIWPDGPEGFRPALVTYYQHAQVVAHRLTTLFAEALGMSPDFFEERTDHSLDTLRVNFFEGLPGEAPQLNQFGIAAHTDYGVLTVLLTDGGPGLEVLDSTDQWRAVGAVSDALVVNIGDLMAQWTNDRWRSTLHRVQPVTARGTEVQRRRSLPFFHEGNYDMIVECLPTCSGPGNPAKYPPVHAGQHVKAKVLSAHLLAAAHATSTLGDRSAALA